MESQDPLDLVRRINEFKPAFRTFAESDDPLDLVRRLNKRPALLDQLREAIELLTTVAAAPSPLGVAFDLKVGQQTVLHGTKLEVGFEAVDDDSRCPIGARCTWEGNARIVVGLSGTRVMLNTTLDPRSADYFGYTVRLVTLRPHRTLGKRIEPQDYAATFFVDTISPSPV